MGKTSTSFGIAMRNFQAWPNLPDAQQLIDYGVRMEELGYESLWVWDHILLGVDPHFPIIDSLSPVQAVCTIAARTVRAIRFLPCRLALSLDLAIPSAVVGAA